MRATPTITTIAPMISNVSLNGQRPIMIKPLMTPMTTETL